MSIAADPPEPPARDGSSRWARLLHHSDDPIFVVNSRSRLLYVNSAWERWAGLTFAEVRAQRCRHSASRGDSPASLLAILSPTKETLAGRPSHVRRRAAPANAPWIDVDFLPWKKDGQVIGVIGRITVVPTAPASAGPPLPERIVQLRERATQNYRLELWESDVPAVQTAVAQARLATQTTVPVIVHGPHGSGKEWLARTIHRLGPRREAFFATIDAQRLASAMIENLLLQSTAQLNIGAILLRQPASLRPDAQIRLAELLADDALGPRLFLAVDNLAEIGGLVPELSAQATALTIRVPSLVERRADWPRLLPVFLARAAAVAHKAQLSLSPEAGRALRLYSWPGNWRELDRVVRDAALRAGGDILDIADLPFSFRGETLPEEPKLPLSDLLQSAERRLIVLALEQARHNKSKAAALLGVWRARLLRRIEQLGIEERGEPGDA